MIDRKAPEYHEYGDFRDTQYYVTDKVLDTVFSGVRATGRFVGRVVFHAGATPSATEQAVIPRQESQPSAPEVPSTGQPDIDSVEQPK